MFQQYWGSWALFSKNFKLSQTSQNSIIDFDSKWVQRTGPWKSSIKHVSTILGNPGPFFWKISNFHKHHKIQYFDSKWACRALKVINKTYWRDSSGIETSYQSLIVATIKHVSTILGALCPFWKFSNFHKHHKIGAVSLTAM